MRGRGEDTGNCKAIRVEAMVMLRARAGSGLDR